MSASGPIPKISPVAVDAITDMLMDEQGMLRPPRKAAALLALIVELHKIKMPFPKREEVTEAIGVGVSTIDAALSSRLSEGYISIAMETTVGNVQRRNSVVRERYYVPSRHLLDVADEALRGRRSRHK